MDEKEEILNLIEEEKKSIDASAIVAPKIEYTFDTSKGYAEQAKEIVGVIATQRAIEDEELVEDVIEKKKEELKENASASLKNEQAKSIEADKSLQDAKYGAFEGIATYAGIKKALPQWMQNALFAILGFVQIIVLIIFGIPTSIFNICADCLNSIVSKISSIAKSARWALIVLACIALFVVLMMFIISMLKKYGIIA